MLFNISDHAIIKYHHIYDTCTPLPILVKSSSVDRIFPKSTYFDSELKSGCWTMVSFVCMSLLVCLHFLVLENRYSHSKLANVLKQIYSQKKWNGNISDDLMIQQPWFPGAAVTHDQKGSCMVGSWKARCGGHQHHWWARCGQPQPSRAFASGESPGAHLAPFSSLQCFDGA